jgi:acyl-CoA reductase-like NAD-dependent aldehyde dehydrogenase/ABC-type branched-subunit amino acid transport system ATPase component
MLEIDGLSLRYGQHLALDDIGLTVGDGETVVILGANGAGKSSLLKAVAGLGKPSEGTRILFGGAPLTDLPAHRIVEQGIALVPEGRGIFPELTVEENLLLGANPARARADEFERRADVYVLFPKLFERRSQRAGTMSGGEQQMVAIGRALMSNPDLLLLDEPSLGLAPIVAGELFATLGRIRQTGVAMLIVEQNVKASLAIADRGYLIEAGRIVGEGAAAELINDTAVQRAFLGAPDGNRNTEHGGHDMDMVGLLIDGESVDSSDGESFERINPITGNVATKAAAATEDDARRAADAAARAFPEWSATSPGERRNLLIAAADALKAKTDEIVAAMAEEIGATAGWAMFNVGLASDMLLEAAALTTQINGEVIPSNRPGTMAMAIRQPAGVVLSMAPWNAPVILGVRSIATPLACGNTVVMKTSEICPRTHRLIVEAVQGAGLPKGVLNVISNAPDDAPEIVEALIAHPAVRRINFTGSTRVGRMIAEAAGRHLKPVLLELGGKAPMIVLDDADLDQAVAAAAFGAYMNQGQICMSTERLVVDDKVADAFCEKLAAKVKTLKAGDPREGNTPLGSVVDERATQRIEELIRDAVDKGAVLAAGGSAEGTIIEATLLDRVTPAMRIYREESFGPVVGIIRVGSIDEAVRVANDTEYGLSAAVFGQNVNRALSVARRIESGICHVNGPTVHDEAQMPFGGVKESGYGRFGGKAGIEEFTELRWITIQDGPLHYPI